MAWMTVIGDCCICGIRFSFNADRVPSVVIDGEREPICRDCVNRANPVRIAKGLPPIHVFPDSYEPQEVP